MDAPSIAAVVSVGVIILVAAIISIVIYFGDDIFESRSRGWFRPLPRYKCEPPKDSAIPPPAGDPGRRIVRRKQLRKGPGRGDRVLPDSPDDDAP
jgi:hypothetical protein